MGNVTQYRQCLSWMGGLSTNLIGRSPAFAPFSRAQLELSAEESSHLLDIQPGPDDLAGRNTLDGYAPGIMLFPISLGAVEVQFGPYSIAFYCLIEDVYLHIWRLKAGLTGRITIDITRIIGRGTWRFFAWRPLARAKVSAT